MAEAADAIEARDAEIERLRAALAASCDEWRSDHKVCPLDDRVASLRGAIEFALEDIERGREHDAEATLQRALTTEGDTP